MTGKKLNWIALGCLLLTASLATAEPKDKGEEAEKPKTYTQISMEISRREQTLTSTHPSVQTLVDATVDGLKPIDDSAAAKQSASMQVKYDVTDSALKLSLPILEKAKQNSLSNEEYNGFLSDLTHTGDKQLPNNTVRNVYDKEAGESTSAPSSGGDGDHPAGAATDDTTDPRVPNLDRFITTMTKAKDFFDDGVKDLAPLLASPTPNNPQPTPPSPSPSNTPLMPYTGMPGFTYGMPPGGQGGGKQGGGGGISSGSVPSGSGPVASGGTQTPSETGGPLAVSRAGEQASTQAVGAAASNGNAGAPATLPPGTTTGANSFQPASVTDDSAVYNPESILEGKPAFRYSNEGGFALGKELSSEKGGSTATEETTTAAAKKSGGRNGSSTYSPKTPEDAKAAKEKDGVFELGKAFPPFEAPFNFDRDSGFGGKAGDAVGDTLGGPESPGAAGKGAGQLYGALRNQVLSTPPEDPLTGRQWLFSYVGYSRKLCGRSQFSLPICPRAGETRRPRAPETEPISLAIAPTDDNQALRAPASILR